MTETMTARPRPVPKNHKPSGKPGWPRILLSGETDTGKSWQSALLSTDDRIPDMFWIEIGDGETTAEEYGAIPGASYTIIDWDGTWSDMDEQLEAHWWLAKEAEENGTGPIGLTVDAASGEWAMLKAFGDMRARQKFARKLENARQDTRKAFDVDQDVTITSDIWGLIDTRHTRWMKWILTWPGPVVLIAREKYVTVHEKGEPTKEKAWSLQVRREMENQMTAWVRLHKGKPAEILKLRSVHNGVRLDHTKRAQEQSADFTLATLIFDWVGCTAESRSPVYRDLDSDQVMPGEAAPASTTQDPPRSDGRRQGRALTAVPTLDKAAAQKVRENTMNWVLFVLKASHVDEAADNDTQHVQAKSWAATTNVLEFLNEDVRERLGIEPGRDVVTFAELGPMVVKYTGAHKQSVLDPVDIDDGAPDAPMAPAPTLDEHEATTAEQAAPPTVEHVPTPEEIEARQADDDQIAEANRLLAARAAREALTAGRPILTDSNQMTDEDDNQLAAAGV